MVGFQLFAAAVLGLAGISNAASARDWESRSIYQVMTDRFAVSDGSTSQPCDLFNYCGGTFQGIINKLDYIQGMGFTAIYISPVVTNIEADTTYGEAYHGYWPQDLYSINKHFGSPDDLKALSSALHARGMYLMVDVVINDMAIAVDGVVTTANASLLPYSGINPFNKEDYYHPFCNITDFSVPSIYQNCWFGVEIVALPDLYTEHDEVVSMIGTWIKELVSNYTIDGVRIDAAKHMNDAYLTSFKEAAGVFTFGEVYTGVVGDMCRYQGLVDGLPNYLAYFVLIDAFTAGNMAILSSTRPQINAGCPNVTLLAPFVENHDLPRIASLVDDIQLAANMLAYTMIGDGMPMVYQGQEQHATGNYSPYNRGAMWKIGYDTSAPLYNLTATLNKLRTHAISTDIRFMDTLSTQLYTDASTIAVSKGPSGVNIVGVLSNQGSGMTDYTLIIPKAFEPGAKAVEVTSCQIVQANSDGNITVAMSKGRPQVFFPQFQMNGSGLCGYTASSVVAGGTNTSTGGGKKSAAEHVQANSLTIVMGAVFALAMWIL